MRTSLINLSILAATASASYLLEDDYTPDQFANMFDFFTARQLSCAWMIHTDFSQDNDPTNGYVNYLSYDQASGSGLYKADNGTIYMGVDSTNVATGRGRDSVRLSTKKTYNQGLIILDLAHMPGGACGTWPAFWMLGPEWPVNGEIDIIEGVNSQSANSMTLHTNAGCSITSTGAFSGTMQTDNCDVNAVGQAANAGCAIESQDDSSYGMGFNSNGGGVYATQWTSEAISIWFFPRNGVPSDISSDNPDPSSWGLPQGQFTGDCDLNDHVKDQQLVFDITFCGDWAGSVWSTDTTCSSQASTCQDYVQNSPSAFQDTYWLINSLKVYTENGAAPTQTVTTTTTSQTATPTSTSESATYTVTTATTLVTITSSLTSSTESTPTYSVSSSPTPETLTSTYPTSSLSSSSTPTAPPTTFVTVTPSTNSPYTAESTITTTGPSSIPTWPSSSGPWSTDSWTNGGGWSGNGWQGGNGNGNPSGGGGDHNGGGWAGRGSGGWR